MEKETILRTEPVTQEQVNALKRSMMPIARMISGIDEVDVSRGRGVLDESNRKHCLWTKAGHRVTVVVSTDGGVIVSKSNEPDEEAPDGE
jgi:hypothetical protein